MQFFIDSANVKEIRECHAMGLVDGVTTNPSLAAKTGRNYDETILEICKIVDGPISAETISLDFENMMKEACHFAKMHKNIVVKIPMTLTGIKAVAACAKEGIKTNVTLVFSATQALLCAKAGATYVSPFVGRLDDLSQVGMDLIGDIRTIYDNYNFETKILVASIRNPVHVRDAALLGADVSTIPYSVIKQLASHPLTDRGIEQFLKDWEKVPK
ncbi:MAG: fructose-6-phosphate aldolase [Deltaproteobacteria bacterium]|nr:fructose-6-phosphate aldolase [Deltaproteobacteria bacterium]